MVSKCFWTGRAGDRKNRVRVVIAGEKRRPDSLAPAPDVSESVRLESSRVVWLEALVRMKLACHRTEDTMDLLDMLEVGLFDAYRPARFPAELAARLQHLIDTPED